MLCQIKTNNVYLTFLCVIDFVQLVGTNRHNDPTWVRMQPYVAPKGTWLVPLFACHRDMLSLTVWEVFVSFLGTFVSKI